MKHDPNLIHWQIAQWQDHPSEAVQACLALFRSIAGKTKTKEDYMGVNE